MRGEAGRAEDRPLLAQPSRSVFIDFLIGTDRSYRPPPSWLARRSFDPS
jgi:hypothetical protein